MLRTGFLVGLALVFPESAPAAQEAMIALGTSVRVESTVERKLHGVLLARDADSLTVARPSGVRTTVPIASVRRIRVRDGRTRAAGIARGAKYGAITAFSLMGAVSLVALSDDEQGFEGVIPLALVVATGYGTILGGVIGFVIGAPRWTEVHGRDVRASYRLHSNGHLTVLLRIN